MLAEARVQPEGGPDAIELGSTGFSLAVASPMTLTVRESADIPVVVAVPTSPRA